MVVSARALRRLLPTFALVAWALGMGSPRAARAEPEASSIEEAMAVDSDDACFEPTALRARVVHWLQRNRLEPRVRVVVSAHGGPRRYVSVLVARDATVIGERRFEHLGARCADALDAVAAAIALVLDQASPASEAPPQAEPRLPSASSGSAASRPSPSPSPSPAARPPRLLPPPARPLSPAPARGLALPFAVEAEVGVAGGVLPRPSTYLQPSVRVEPTPHLRLFLGSTILIPARGAFGGGEITMGLVTGHAGACGVWSLAPRLQGAGCGQLDVGLLSGRGSGYSRNGSLSRVWSSASLGPSLDFRLSAHWSVGASVQAGLVLTRSELTLEYSDGSVLRRKPSILWAKSGLHLRWTF